MLYGLCEGRAVRACTLKGGVHDDLPDVRVGATTGPPRDTDADVRRDYDFADRLGTKKGWEDFLARYKTGSYADQARDKLARLDTTDLQLALQQATFAAQQRQIAHLQSFVDRFRAKATKAKQAQSRIKAIERMELIAAAHVDSPFEFTFAPAAAAARQLVLLEHVEHVGLIFVGIDRT